MSIKINQNNQMDVGKSNSTTQTEAIVGSSFNQILAMFSPLDQIPEVDGQPVTGPSLQHTSDLSGNSINHKVNLSEKDWEQLDLILTNWDPGIQQNEYLFQDTEVNTLTSETDPTLVKTVNAIQPNNVEESKELAQWLHRVDGSSQTSTMEPTQLVEELARVISELQLLEGNNTIEVPIEIEEKLQIILSETYIGNEISGDPLINDNLTDKKLKIDDRKNSASLDIRIQEGRIPFAAKVNEVIQKDISKTVADWLQKTEGLNQDSPVDPIGLVQELAQLISDLQLQDGQKLSNTPSENVVENPIFLRDSLQDNNLVTEEPLILPNGEDELSFRGGNNLVSEAVKSGLDLIQNPVILPLTSESTTHDPEFLKNKFDTGEPLIHPKREAEFSFNGVKNLVSEAVNSALNLDENPVILPLNTESTPYVQEAKLTEKVSTILPTPVEKTIISPLPQTTVEVIKTVAQWIQKVEGLGQNEVIEPMKLVQELTRLIDELQTQVGVKRIPLVEIEENLPNVPSVANSKNTLIQSFRDNRSEFSDSPLINSNLVTDGKVVTLPVQPKVTTHIQDGAVLTNLHVKDMNRLPTNVEMNIPTQRTTTDVIKTVVDWLQKVEDRNETALLDSSELVQEIDNLIREIKSVDGRISLHPEDGQRVSKKSNMFDMNHSLLEAKVENSSQSPVLPTLNLQLQSVSEMIEVVTKWIHKVDDLNQSATLDPKQLVRELEKLLGELQTQKGISSEKLTKTFGNNLETRTWMDLGRNNPITPFKESVDGTRTTQAPVSAQVQASSLTDGQSQKLSMVQQVPIKVDTGISTLVTKDQQQPTLDFKQLIQEFEKLLSELQLQKGQVNVENTDKTGDSLEAMPLLDASSKLPIRTKQKHEENILPRQAEGSSLVKGESSYQQVATEVSKVLIQWLQETKGMTQSQQSSTETSNLDSTVKTEIDNNMNSSLPNIATSSDKEMNLAAPLDQVGEGTKSSDQPLVGTNPIKGSDATVSSKAIPTPPVLTFTSFVPEVSEWMGRFMRISNNPMGSSEARFSLYPEHLGHVEIKISTQEGQVSAQIITDTSLAKDTLEGQLQQLRQALQQHGIQVQKLEIVQQLPTSVDSNQGNPSFSHSGSSSSHEQRTTNSGKGGTKKDNEADEIEGGREVISAPAPYGKPTSKIASRIDFTA